MKVKGLDDGDSGHDRRRVLARPRRSGRRFSDNATGCRFNPSGFEALADGTAPSFHYAGKCTYTALYHRTVEAQK